MKKLLLIIITFVLATSLHADLIGEISFTGQFTTNHLFDFNNPGAEPIGTFGQQTVSNVSGIFSGHVSTGDILGGAGVLNAVNGPIFTLPGLTFLTPLGVNISGTNLVSADTIILGLQLPPDFTFAIWMFEAPGALDSDHDITGPISFSVRAFNPVFVPDGGNTALIYGCALTGIFFLLRRYA
jgi:hypothetical protein